MPSSPPTVLGGSALPLIIQKQETHGAQSMGFYFSPTPTTISIAFKPTFFIERRMLIRWCSPCSFFLFFLLLPIN
ncbi:MAG: hypothetical protein DWH70_07790 [Planctomycetota bacterium]|nr:MAG: hypothetical protein DWH70_07790 [Planctomycetota bacterium]